MRRRRCALLIMIQGHLVFTLFRFFVVNLHAYLGINSHCQIHIAFKGNHLGMHAKRCFLCSNSVLNAPAILVNLLLCTRAARAASPASCTCSAQVTRPWRRFHTLMIVCTLMHIRASTVFSCRSNNNSFGSILKGS